MVAWVRASFVDPDRLRPFGVDDEAQDAIGLGLGDDVADLVALHVGADVELGMLGQHLAELTRLRIEAEDRHRVPAAGVRSHHQRLVIGRKPSGKNAAPEARSLRPISFQGELALLR